VHGTPSNGTRTYHEDIIFPEQWGYREVFSHMVKELSPHAGDA
jgi:hypothetical protein